LDQEKNGVLKSASKESQRKELGKKSVGGVAETATSFDATSCLPGAHTIVLRA